MLENKGKKRKKKEVITSLGQLHCSNEAKLRDMASLVDCVIPVKHNKLILFRFTSVHI